MSGGKVASGLMAGVGMVPVALYADDMEADADLIVAVYSDLDSLNRLFSSTTSGCCIENFIWAMAISILLVRDASRDALESADTFNDSEYEAIKARIINNV